MKKILIVSQAIALFFILSYGCTISRIDTASNNTGDEQKTEEVKAYEVLERKNISRVSLFNHQGSKAEIEIDFTRTTNVNLPENINLRGSSGSIEHSGTFIGFKDIEFPFTGTVEYTIKPRLSKNEADNSKTGNNTRNTASDLRCRLTFTVNKSGSWIVKIGN